MRLSRTVTHRAALLRRSLRPTHRLPRALTRPLNPMSKRTRPKSRAVMPKNPTVTHPNAKTNCSRVCIL